MLCFCAVSSIRGSRRRASNVLDISLTCALYSICSVSKCPEQTDELAYDDSHPSSVKLSSVVASPAFSIKISKRPPSFSNLSPKALTDEKSASSRTHASTFLQPVSCSISKKAHNSGYSLAGESRRIKDILATASLPFSWLLDVKISLPGPMRAKCFAASNPIPVFAPVTITVFLLRSCFGTGGTVVHCALTKSKSVNFMDKRVLGCSIFSCIKDRRAGFKRLEWRLAKSNLFVRGSFYTKSSNTTHSSNSTDSKKGLWPAFPCTLKDIRVSSAAAQIWKHWNRCRPGFWHWRSSSRQFPSANKFKGCWWAVYDWCWNRVLHICTSYT